MNDSSKSNFKTETIRKCKGPHVFKDWLKNIAPLAMQILEVNTQEIFHIFFHVELRYVIFVICAIRSLLRFYERSLITTKTKYK